MDTEELNSLAKELSEPSRPETILRFRDGRSYSVPLNLSDQEIANVERNMPNDQVMRLIGYRLPDFMPWIEPTFHHANYARLYV